MKRETEVQYLAAILAVGITIANKLGVDSDEWLEYVEEAWRETKKPA